MPRVHPTGKDGVLVTRAKKFVYPKAVPYNINGNIVTVTKKPYVTWQSKTQDALGGIKQYHIDPCVSDIINAVKNSKHPDAAITLDEIIKFLPTTTTATVYYPTTPTPRTKLEDVNADTLLQVFNQAVALNLTATDKQFLSIQKKSQEPLEIKTVGTLRPLVNKRRTKSTPIATNIPKFDNNDAQLLEAARAYLLSKIGPTQNDRLLLNKIAAALQLYAKVKEIIDTDNRQTRTSGVDTFIKSVETSGGIFRLLRNLPIQKSK